MSLKRPADCDISLQSLKKKLFCNMKNSPVKKKPCQCEEFLKLLKIPVKQFPAFLGKSFNPTSNLSPSEINRNISKKEWSISFGVHEMAPLTGCLNQKQNRKIENIYATLFEEPTEKVNELVNKTVIKSNNECYNEKLANKTVQDVITDLHVALNVRMYKFMVAGGFMSYVLGKTTEYNDIDIFVMLDNQSEKEIDDICLKLAREFGFHHTVNSYINTDWKSITHPHLNLNIILTSHSKEYQVKPGMFTRHLRVIEILHNFDIPVCKTAYIFSHELVCDLTFLNHNYESIYKNIDALKDNFEQHVADNWKLKHLISRIYKYSERLSLDYTIKEPNAAIIELAKYHLDSLYVYNFKLKTRYFPLLVNSLISENYCKKTE